MTARCCHELHKGHAIYRLFGVFKCWTITNVWCHREAKRCIRWPFRWMFAVEMQ